MATRWVRIVVLKRVIVERKAGRSRWLKARVRRKGMPDDGERSGSETAGGR